MPKATTPVEQNRRHNPLEDDLLATGPLRTKTGKRKARDEDGEEKFVDSKASRKILRIGQELADEEEEGEAVTKPSTAFDFESRFEDEEEPEGTYDDEEAWGDEYEVVEEFELAPDDLETFSKFFPAEDDPQDLLLKHGWGNSEDKDEGEQEQGTNLADLILEKIAAHEAAQARNGGVNVGGTAMEEDYELPPKVVEVYTKCVPWMLFWGFN
jgi:essential nuclear protein 1